jgi:hypothetical protein
MNARSLGLFQNAPHAAIAQLVKNEAAIHHVK